MDGVDYVAAYGDPPTPALLFKRGRTVVSAVDATPFVRDGMVSSVEVSGGNLVITFNMDAESEPISIPLTAIFNPENYYSRTAADETFVAKEQGKGLSTNDYTTAEQQKLAGIAAGAQVNPVPVGPADATEAGQFADALAVKTALAGKANWPGVSPTEGHMAVFGQDGYLADGGKGPDDFVTIGTSNQQPFDDMGSSPLFSVELMRDDGAGTLESAYTMDFGADSVDMADSYGHYLQMSPDYGITLRTEEPSGIDGVEPTVYETILTQDRVMSSALSVDMINGRTGYGVGDVTFDSNACVRTMDEYDSSGDVSVASILRVATDYEATLAPLGLYFSSGGELVEYGTPETSHGSATVSGIVDLVTDWNGGYPVVSCLYVDNYDGHGHISYEGQDPLTMEYETVELYASDVKELKELAVTPEFHNDTLVFHPVVSSQSAGSEE